MADGKKNEGNARFREGNFAQAIKLYSEAICFHPTEPAYYLNRAKAHLQAARDEAERDSGSKADLLELEWCIKWFLEISPVPDNVHFSSRNPSDTRRPICGKMDTPRNC